MTNQENKLTYNKKRNRAYYKGFEIYVYRSSGYNSSSYKMYYACYEAECGGRTRKEIMQNIDDNIEFLGLKK
tara:strand:+ start:263 stop:478 length:216 start_codon:yes stop_codon:yes gene_type:complete